MRSGLQESLNPAFFDRWPGGGYTIQDMRLAIDADQEKPAQFQLYLENSHIQGGQSPMPT